MGNASKNTYVVLLCGGSGTRLWPASTQRHPKQFSRLMGPQSLFQKTITRIKDVVPLERILVVTNKEYIDDLLRQEPMLPTQNIIAEPQRRNTAMAMGVAAAYIFKRNPDATIINLATDHVIQDLAGYQKTLLTASEFAAHHKCLVAIGIVPTHPHTGLGHIKMGQKVGDVDGLPVYKSDGFKEKPDLETAKTFTASGQYLWNACNFVWYAATFLSEFKRLTPDIYEQIDRIYQAIGTPEEKNIFEEAYAEVRSDAIDYAVAEKTDKLYVIPGQFGWNDVGDWEVLYGLSEKDKNGNVINIGSDHAEVVTFDSKNCLVNTENKLVALVGVEDLVIINTYDALLICKKDKAQSVKEIVKILDSKNLTKYL